MCRGSIDSCRCTEAAKETRFVVGVIRKIRNEASVKCSKCNTHKHPCLISENGVCAVCKDDELKEKTGCRFGMSICGHLECQE